VNRTEKQQLVASLRETFSSSASIVVTHYAGLTVQQMTVLRRNMRAGGASLVVPKNKLAKIAVKGTPYEHLADLFKGPTAVSYSADPVAAAKTVVDFAKKNEKLVIIGGGLQDKALGQEAIQYLAKLPSLDGLRSSLLGIINAPATKVAGVIQAPAAQLARVFAAYAKQG